MYALVNTRNNEVIIYCTLHDLANELNTSTKHLLKAFKRYQPLGFELLTIRKDGVRKEVHKA